MKFGTGWTTKQTQKYMKVKVQMTYVHPHIYTNKYPQFSIELPLIVSHSLHSLANCSFCHSLPTTHIIASTANPNYPLHLSHSPHAPPLPNDPPTPTCSIHCHMLHPLPYAPPTHDPPIPTCSTHLKLSVIETQICTYLSNIYTSYSSPPSLSPSRTCTHTYTQKL